MTFKQEFVTFQLSLLVDFQKLFVSKDFIRCKYVTAVQNGTEYVFNAGEGEKT